MVPVLRRDPRCPRGAAVTWAEEVAAIRHEYAPAKAQRARAVLEAVAREHGMTPKLVLGPCRVRRLVAARRETAIRLVEEGLSVREVAMVMGRDHSSILYLLGRLAKCREAA